MATVLYLDCFSGVSGDMLLGALIDAGLPVAALHEALGSLALGGLEIRADRVMRSGIASTRFQVLETNAAERRTRGAAHADDDGRHSHHDAGQDRQHDNDGPGHHRGGDQATPGGHAHASPHHGHRHAPETGGAAVAPPAHGHRSLAEIERLIDRSALSPLARARARDLFVRLARVEADIHDLPLDRVHLHEVGALDSIVDIVGAVFALDWFGADRIVASPLNVGGGTVQCDHGLLPVPAPATARLLAGVPIYARGDHELVTPTGALLVTAYAASYGPLPPMIVDRIGYGAGARDTPRGPNVLRVLVGRDAAEPGHERVVVLQCEIDDMNPQIFGLLMDRLLAAGALDVFYQPVQMKKNRPGTLVTILGPPDRQAALTSVLFEESTSIGVRSYEADRECLARERVDVATPWGAVGMKVARRGGRVMNAQPEFDECVRLASAHGVSLKQVQAAAVKAWLDAGGFENRASDLTPPTPER